MECDNGIVAVMAKDCVVCAWFNDITHSNLYAQITIFSKTKHIYIFPLRPTQIYVFGCDLFAFAGIVRWENMVSRIHFAMEYTEKNTATTYIKSPFAFRVCEWVFKEYLSVLFAGHTKGFLLIINHSWCIETGIRNELDGKKRKRVQKLRSYENFDFHAWQHSKIDVVANTRATLFFRSVPSIEPKEQRRTHTNIRRALSLRTILS